MTFDANPFLSDELGGNMFPDGFELKPLLVFSIIIVSFVFMLLFSVYTRIFAIAIFSMWLAMGFCEII